MIRRRPDHKPINALEDGIFTFPFKDFYDFVKYSLWLASLSPIEDDYEC